MWGLPGWVLWSAGVFGLWLCSLIFYTHIRGSVAHPRLLPTVVIVTTWFYMAAVSRCWRHIMTSCQQTCFVVYVGGTTVNLCFTGLVVVRGNYLMSLCRQTTISHHTRHMTDSSSLLIRLIRTKQMCLQSMGTTQKYLDTLKELLKGSTLLDSFLFIIFLPCHFQF